jgi:hypothetical protein
MPSCNNLSLLDFAGDEAAMVPINFELSDLVTSGNIFRKWRVALSVSAMGSSIGDVDSVCLINEDLRAKLVPTMPKKFHAPSLGLLGLSQSFTAQSGVLLLKGRKRVSLSDFFFFLPCHPILRS